MQISYEQALRTILALKVSQRIFQNQGFYLINEKDYESYKDNQGHVIIKHDIHTSAQILASKLIE